MGCNSSKQAAVVEGSKHQSGRSATQPSKSTTRHDASSKDPAIADLLKHKETMDEADSDQVYNLLVRAHTKHDDGSSSPTAYSDDKALQAINRSTASYQHPTTKSTPLHMAVRLLDTPKRSGVPELVIALLEAYPKALHKKDASGFVPLYYAVCPQNTKENGSGSEGEETSIPSFMWEQRAAVFSILSQADETNFTKDYLDSNDISFSDTTRGCSVLYRALQMIPDDFDVAGHTVTFIQAVFNASGPRMVGAGNAFDGDKPLALLYRRFTRQFDLAEKFFSGDNSRPEVVEHRRRYKTAAANTWKIIESLLRTSQGDDGGAYVVNTVHRAVQVETPPDLLRYIVETNAEDLASPDDAGKLPLHHAALTKPVSDSSAFPAFYSKYVIDELLYKYPEAASVADSDGNLPMVLAVRAGKQWIGGGIKSLYEAYPDALSHINLDHHGALKAALSMEESTQAGDPKEEKETESIIRDEHHDAIMLVQQPNVDVSEVVTSLWAHEEDPGVQMLGCVALSKMVSLAEGKPEKILRIALSAVPAVVNAMKAHPNEVIVQEKACNALRGLADSDGKREVSFVASGAVAAIVGAMQAHVSDPGVQEEACGAITKVLRVGGDDRATIVASVSGLTAIVNAIAAHPHVVGVQQYGCAALREMTEHPHANLPEVPRSQVEQLLQSAKQKYPMECEDNVDVLMSRLA